jgi:hypothetical protein
VHLALPEGERETFDDFLFADGDVEVFDFERGHGRNEEEREKTVAGS